MQNEFAEKTQKCLSLAGEPPIFQDCAEGRQQAQNLKARGMSQSLMDTPQARAKCAK